MTSSQKRTVVYEVQKCIAVLLEHDSEPLKDLELDNDESYTYAVACLAKIVQLLRDGAVLTQEAVDGCTPSPQTLFGALKGDVDVVGDIIEESDCKVRG